MGRNSQPGVLDGLVQLPRLGKQARPASGGGAGDIITPPNDATFRILTNDIPTFPGTSPSSMVSNGTFVGFMSGADGYTTTDGLSATFSSTAPNGGAVMAFGGGIYMIANSDTTGIATSPDFINWTSRTPAISGQTAYGAAYGNGVFVIVGLNGTIQSSSNGGATWVDRTIAISDGFRMVRFALGLFIAAGENGILYTSPDGATWTARTSGTANLINGGGCDGTTIRLTTLNDYTTLVSTNGTTWATQVINVSGSAGSARDLVFGNGIWMFAGDDIERSTDGVNFSFVRIISGYFLTNATYLASTNTFFTIGNFQS